MNCPFSRPSLLISPIHEKNRWAKPVVPKAMVPCFGVLKRQYCALFIYLPSLFSLGYTSLAANKSYIVQQEKRDFSIDLTSNNWFISKRSVTYICSRSWNLEGRSWTNPLMCTCRHRPCSF